VSLTRDQAQAVLRFTREAIQGMGMAQKHTRLNLCSHLRMEKMPESVRFAHDPLVGSVFEMRQHVEERVRVSLNDLRHALVERGADPSFGVEVLGGDDLRETLGAAWNPHMGHYVVWIAWQGPVPETWPAKLTPEDIDPALAKQDDAGYIRDYRAKNPEGWDEALRVLKGGRALDEAAKEAANGPKLPSPLVTA